MKKFAPYEEIKRKKISEILALPAEDVKIRFDPDSYISERKKTGQPISSEEE